MPYCTTDWYVSNRVGIGTDNPGFRLVICDTNNPMVQLKNPNDTSFGVILEHTGLNSEYWNYENGYIRFGTANAERLRITNGGNIGIGATGPSTKLHVVNNDNRAYTPTVFNDTSHALHIQFCDQNQRAGLIRWTSHGNLENSFGVVQMGCSNGGASCGQGDFVFQAYRTAGGALYCELMRITNQGCVYFNGGGNVGIGTTTPVDKLEVKGVDNGITISSAANDRPALSFCSGTALCLKLSTNNLYGAIGDGSNTDRYMVFRAGNIGIGTTSPDARLTVNAPSANTVVANIKSTTGNNLFNFISNDTPGHAILDMGRCTESGTFAAGFIRLRTDGNSWIQGGDVGIGTSSPNARLHVQGSSADGTATFRVTSTSAADSFNYAGTIINGCLCSNRNYILLIGQDLSNRNSGYIGYNHTGTSNSNNNFLTFGHYQSDNLLNLLGNGNVGIGTTSPSQKLHVAGTSLFTDTMNFELGKISWNSTRFVITSCGTANIALATDNFTDRMTIQCGTGNVGIGTSSPSQRLHVTGRAIISNGTGTNESLSVGTTSSSTGTNFGTIDVNGLDYSAYYLRTNDTIRFSIFQSGGVTAVNTITNIPLTLGTCDTERMRITNAGNVGINTSSPSYRLHVNGTFYAAGSSIKYKEGICNYNIDSCLFMCLKPVAYQYKDEFKHLGKELKSDIQIGLIAEDVAEVMPELAVLVNEEDEKVVRNVDYEKLSIVLLAEVQKLRKEVDALKS